MQTYLKFVLLTVHNDSADLLVHEDENGDQQGGDKAGQVHPPWVLSKRHHQPATVRASRLLEEESPFYFQFISTVVHKQFPHKKISPKAYLS